MLKATWHNTILLEHTGVSGPQGDRVCTHSSCYQHSPANVLSSAQEPVLIFHHGPPDCKILVLFPRMYPTLFPCMMSQFLQLYTDSKCHQLWQSYLAHTREHLSMSTGMMHVQYAIYIME